MAQPTTRYARAGEVNIAYQVIGDGPVDLVWAWGLASNIEVAWEEPLYVRVVGDADLHADAGHAGRRRKLAGQAERHAGQRDLARLGWAAARRLPCQDPP